MVSGIIATNDDHIFVGAIFPKLDIVLSLALLIFVSGIMTVLLFGASNLSVGILSFLAVSSIYLYIFDVNQNKGISHDEQVKFRWQWA